MTYKIFEGNLERLEKKLTRIANKCKKYGCDFRYEQVGEVFEDVKDDKGETHTARFVLIEAEGTAKVNDWQFVATVEHTEKGNIIEGYAGIEVPERYYTGKPICEHCNSNRYRKNTYIIRNIETGEFKQVGKSCLKDFTHGLSAEMVAQYISGFQELIEGEEPSEGCWFPRYINRDKFLAYAAETIHCFGYVKRNYDVPGTAERAIDFYDAAHGKLRPIQYQNDVLEVMKKANFNADNQVEYVKDALSWLEQQPESNNYFHNLKVACSLEYIGVGHYGLLTSLFPAYNRELEYQAEKARKERMQQKELDSVHVGKINERITVKVKSVKCVTSWETAYGITRIYKILDEIGNVFTWKTGTILEEETPGFSLVGTVKAHNEYRGIKQTELTRCRVAA